MSGITVTMSMHEYERMKKEIEELKKKNVQNYIHTKYDDIHDPRSYIRTLDFNSIRQDFGGNLGIEMTIHSDEYSK